MRDERAADDRDAADVAGDVGVLVGGGDREGDASGPRRRRPGGVRAGAAALRPASAWRSSATMAASSSAARASSSGVSVPAVRPARDVEARRPGRRGAAGRAAGRCIGRRWPGRVVVPLARLAMVWSEASVDGVSVGGGRQGIRTRLVDGRG